jgi:hypothetical protein
LEPVDELDDDDATLDDDDATLDDDDATLDDELDDDEYLQSVQHDVIEITSKVSGSLSVTVRVA